MTKLIDPSTRERPIPRVIGGGARLPVVQPSGTEGRGIAALGQDLSNIADVEVDRMNSLRAEDAFNKLRERQLDLTFGEQNGFTRLKGADVVGRNVLQEWGKRFEDVEKEIDSTLGNDAQRQLFKKRADVARLQYKEGILRHYAQQNDVYATQVYDGVLATERQNVVARWDSPTEVSMSLDRIKNAVESRGDREGWNPEYRKAVFREESGRVHASVVKQAIANTDYRYALEWYKQHSEDVDLNTSLVLTEQLEKQSAKFYQQQRDIQEYELWSRIYSTDGKRATPGEITEAVQQRIIDPEAGKQMLSALSSDEGRSDNGSFVMAVENQIYRGADARKTINNGFQEGQIKLATASRLLALNQRIIHEEEDTPYKRFRSLLHQATQTKGLMAVDLGGEPERRAQALIEYDQLVLEQGANPQQAYESVLARTKTDLASINIRTERMILPRYHVGGRADLDVNATALKLREAFYRGEINRSELAEEVRRLKEWEEALNVTRTEQSERRRKK